MNTVKTLIHLHTDYSYDSEISLETLASFVRTEDIGCVAVTDHDTIEGALRFRHMTDAHVIVGEEITTRDGHLIGLFLEHRIRPGMSALATARAIREQGGLVLIPHPFVALFGCGLRDVAYEIAHLSDAVEINNAQNFFSAPDRRAARFAAETGLVRYVGADSHMVASIAPCYQWMRPFHGASDFLAALATAELSPGRHPLAYFLATGQRLIRSMLGLPLSGAFGAHMPAHGAEGVGAAALSSA